HRRPLRPAASPGVHRPDQHGPLLRSGARRRRAPRHRSDQGRESVDHARRSRRGSGPATRRRRCAAGQHRLVGRALPALSRRRALRRRAARRDRTRLAGAAPGHDCRGGPCRYPPHWSGHPEPRRHPRCVGAAPRGARSWARRRRKPDAVGRRTRPVAVHVLPTQDCRRQRCAGTSDRDDLRRRIAVLSAPVRSATVTTLRVPFPEPIADATHRLDVMDLIVLELTDDAGVVGFSYALGFDYASEVLAAMVVEAARHAIGTSPAQRASTWAASWNRYEYVGRSGIAAWGLAAVDIALWDLYG